MDDAKTCLSDLIMQHPYVFYIHLYYAVGWVGRYLG